MGNSSSAEKQTKDIVSQVLPGGTLPEWANPDDIKDLPALKAKMRAVGLESSSLIMAIDFTSSNKDTGRDSFGGMSLHQLDSTRDNPYQQVMAIMGKMLADFDDDGQIPLLGFGDVRSRHHSVTRLGPPSGCSGVDGILSQYRRTLTDPDFGLSGPTSFAPVINEAVKIVEQSGGQYHILVIVGDGQISNSLGCLADTKKAIVSASKHPLSIVFVGVGDGPWDQQEEFDDELPERDFDNFQFVNFGSFQQALAKTKAGSREIIEAAFAVCALQEVPAQYRAIKHLGLLENKPTSRGSKREREEGTSTSALTSASRARLE